MRRLTVAFTDKRDRGAFYAFAYDPNYGESVESFAMNAMDRERKADEFADCAVSELTMNWTVEDVEPEVDVSAWEHGKLVNYYSD